MIKVILFDMVGPLLKKDPHWAWDEVVDRAEALNKGATSEEFIQKLKEDPLTKAYSIEEIARRVVNKYVKIPEIWQKLLPKLKVQYKLAVVNNGMSITLPYFKQKNNFAEFFELFVNSSEEGIAKPEAKIYQIACQRLSVKPEECVFIDDVRKNVIGAEKLGMKGIVYKGYEDCLEKFRNLGIF